MELFLNLVWVTVAAGAFVVILPRVGASRRNALALACLVALLFPIISITDDLVVDGVMAEESSTVRKAASTRVLRGASGAFVDCGIVEPPSTWGSALVFVAFVHVALCATSLLSIEYCPSYRGPPIPLLPTART